jgi:hypothetical protein
MSVQVYVEVERRSFDRAQGDVLIAGIFADERPIRGAAGAVDWRLCGPVSRRLVSGKLEGKIGEAVLLSTYARLLVPRVLLLGLGDRALFTPHDIHVVTREAVGRALELGARRLVLEPLGVDDADFPDHVDAVLGATLEAAKAFEVEMLLCLLLRGDDRVQTASALRAAVSGAKRGSIRLVTEKPRAVRPRAPRVASPAP